MKNSSLNWTVIVILVLIGSAAVWQWGQEPDGDVETAFANGTSGQVVMATGMVQRVLPDDRDGSAHQRFILEMPSGLTLLVAHNIDLAPRVPGLRIGDEISVKGEYEWNEQGGVVHWTHLDPDGRHEGGWIRYRGETYE